jgi:hypothetical protein
MHILSVSHLNRRKQQLNTRGMPCQICLEFPCIFLLTNRPLYFHPPPLRAVLYVSQSHAAFASVIAQVRLVSPPVGALICDGRGLPA